MRFPCLLNAITQCPFYTSSHRLYVLYEKPDPYARQEEETKTFRMYFYTSAGFETRNG